MAAKLVAEEGALKGLVLSLEDGDQWVIGRDPDACQLLIEDPSASRKHLVCRSSPQGIIVENLSETNPIQVNEEEVKEPRLLQNGDAVKIGDGTFRFYAEDSAHLFEEPNDQEPPEQGTPQKATEENEEEVTPEQPEAENSSSDAAYRPPASKTEEATPKPTQENEEATAMERSTKEDQPETPPSDEAAAASQALQEIPQENAVPDNEERHDTIFDEEPSDKNKIAEINFGLLDTGRWLLKVISGPNNGAEFSMQSGHGYIIGTDPNACDIVFHDTSVSRQHARISVSEDDQLSIEDLKSRNKTLIEGTPIEGKQPLGTNLHVSLGTTSFLVFDREGEMKTIISPLMPSIVKVLQTEESNKQSSQEAEAKALEAAAAAAAAEPLSEAASTKNLGAFLLIGVLTGLFVIVGIGTAMLFRSEPVIAQKTVDPMKELDSALSQFPSVKYSFNPNTGQLLLVGHVLTTTDKNQLLYSLRGLSFIKSLDDNGVVIDEYVWREINQVLEKNPAWKGITVMAASPGKFVVSGYLETQTQAERLSEYLSANFPYPDLLEKKIVVDQEILNQINLLLQNKGIKTVTAKLSNGEVTLAGGIPKGKIDDFNAILAEVKEIRGVRMIRNVTSGISPEASVINISDKYEVTGISNQGGNLSVVINGRILMKGDVLDGMTITTIQTNVIYLEKDDVKYKIDINR